MLFVDARRYIALLSACQPCQPAISLLLLDADSATRFSPALRHYCHAAAGGEAIWRHHTTTRQALRIATLQIARQNTQCVGSSLSSYATPSPAHHRLSMLLIKGHCFRLRA